MTTKRKTIPPKGGHRRGLSERQKAEEAAKNNLRKLMPDGHPYPFRSDANDSAIAADIRDYMDREASYKDFPLTIRYLVGDTTGRVEEGGDTAKNFRSSEEISRRLSDEILQARRRMAGEDAVAVIEVADARSTRR